MVLKEMSREQLEEALLEENRAFKKLLRADFSVDMTRGRPSKEQLDIAMPMLQNAASYNYVSAEGADARNYGDPAGTKAARELFADLFGVKSSEVIVADGSSLDIMYNLIQFAVQFGVLGGTPWKDLEKVKFICPAPGYDRHFSICSLFGISMITVPMYKYGPDMNLVELLIREDETVKGMWCVPKYSNPTGVVYSDDVVDRIAKLKPKAKDFRVYWDNAYMVHGLYEEEDKLRNVFELAKKYGNEDMIYQFTSTSKITFAGSGVAAFSSSERNVQDILKKLYYKQINPNKVNQTMHVEFLKDRENINKIMAKHAEILRPKFQLFDEKMSEEFTDNEDVKWSKPRGGYFISLDVKGVARRVVELAKSAGVLFTPAGSTYPYMQDDTNTNIRIAPSVPSLDELGYAVDVLKYSIKIALIEKYIAILDKKASK